MQLKKNFFILLTLLLVSVLMTYQVALAETPKNLNGINKVSIGTQHMLVQGRDGSIWSGGNSMGPTWFPGLVASKFGKVAGISNIVDISAGHNQTLALTSDGTVLSWPGAVRITAVKDVVAIQAGSGFNMVLSGDGTVWTWGAGLGDVPPRSVPTKVSNLSNIVEITGTNQNAAALRSDGSVWTWGISSSYPVGTEQDSTQPGKMDIPVNIKHIYQKAGYGAAVDINGEVWTWGNNGTGQLGDGTTVNKIKPSKVEGLKNIKQLALGNTYVLALKEDGKVIGWGGNSRGQLGDGTTTNSLTPVAVKGLENINSISAGAVTSAAVSNSSEIFVWGMDMTESGANVSTPKRVFISDYVLPTPQDLKLILTSPASVTLTWTGDLEQDTNVNGFNVYHNNILIGTTKENKYAVNDLDPAQEHRFYITTKGVSGEESNPSNTVLKKGKQNYKLIYNAAGQLTSIIYDSGQKIVYEYDLNGNLKKKIIIMP